MFQMTPTNYGPPFLFECQIKQMKTENYSLIKTLDLRQDGRVIYDELYVP